ncbi:MAG: hypothetical protein ACI9D4_002482, partial [Polaribacter sp.]
TLSKTTMVLLIFFTYMILIFKGLYLIGLEKCKKVLKPI